MIYIYMLYVYMMCIYIYIYMAMCHLLGALGEHNPAWLFHIMQAHLRAWAPLGPSRAGPLWAPLHPLWAGPSGPPLGPHGLGRKYIVTASMEYLFPPVHLTECCSNGTWPYVYYMYIHMYICIFT